MANLAIGHVAVEARATLRPDIAVLRLVQDAALPHSGFVVKPPRRDDWDRWHLGLRGRINLEDLAVLERDGPPGAGPANGPLTTSSHVIHLLSALDLGGIVEIERGPRLLLRLEAADLITFYPARTITIDGVQLEQPRLGARSSMQLSVGIGWRFD